jgi:hypothetical protein
MVKAPGLLGAERKKLFSEFRKSLMKLTEAEAISIFTRVIYGRRKLSCHSNGMYKAVLAYFVNKAGLSFIALTLGGCSIQHFSTLIFAVS